MNDNNEKKEKKAGVGGLFGSGGSSAVGSGASSGFGSGGGLAGLFASKAGILGMVLGGATLAAAREKLDYFLYSGGDSKQLIVGDSLRDPDGTAVLIFYAAAKARHLKKKLRITCRASGCELGKNRFPFLKESGAFLTFS